MTAYGEPAWPPAGNNPGHHQGDPLAANGEIPVTVDRRGQPARGAGAVVAAGEASRNQRAA